MTTNYDLLGELLSSWCAMQCQASSWRAESTELTSACARVHPHAFSPHKSDVTQPRPPRTQAAQESFQAAPRNRILFKHVDAAVHSNSKSTAKPHHHAQHNRTNTRNVISTKKHTIHPFMHEDQSSQSTAPGPLLPADEHLRRAARYAKNMEPCPSPGPPAAPSPPKRLLKAQGFCRICCPVAVLQRLSKELCRPVVVQDGGIPALHGPALFLELFPDQIRATYIINYQHALFNLQLLWFRGGAITCHAPLLNPNLWRTGDLAHPTPAAWPKHSPLQRPTMTTQFQVDDHLEKPLFLFSARTDTSLQHWHQESHERHHSTSLALTHSRPQNIATRHQDLPTSADFEGKRSRTNSRTKNTKNRSQHVTTTGLRQLANIHLSARPSASRRKALSDPSWTPPTRG